MCLEQYAVFYKTLQIFYKKCVDDIDEHKFNSKDVRKHVWYNTSNFFNQKNFKGCGGTFIGQEFYKIIVFDILFVVSLFEIHIIIRS